MRSRRLGAVVESGLVNKSTDPSGEVTTASVKSAKRPVIRVVRNVGVARINRRAIVNLGVDQDVDLFVAGAGEKISSFFILIIRETKIGVAVTAVNFQPAKPMDQVNIENTGHGVG